MENIRYLTLEEMLYVAGGQLAFEEDEVEIETITVTGSSSSSSSGSGTTVTCYPSGYYDTSTSYNRYECQEWDRAHTDNASTFNSNVDKSTRYSSSSSSSSSSQPK